MANLHTAARLPVGIDIERPALIALLDRAWRRATGERVASGAVSGGCPWPVLAGVASIAGDSDGVGGAGLLR
jgi:hypothetical protein